MYRLPLVLALITLPVIARAQQHEGHRHDPLTGQGDETDPRAPASDTTRWSHEDIAAFLRASGFDYTPPAQAHDGHAAEDAGADDHAAAGHDMPAVGQMPGVPEMTSSTSPDEPMSRDASGTAWLPQTSPMEAMHLSSGGWSLMVHGAAFLRYTAQDVFESGTRGDRSPGLPNWVMGMAQRPVGNAGVFTARAMLSLDPLTEGGNGYPLLFQSGETFEGERLVDRQHPHELFSELSLAYAQRVAPTTSVFGYVGFPGEPVAGPVAFMHRPSARYIPDSPLGHHWHDATHIAFGVATLGIATGPVKVDASVFTGAEPDEERFGSDTPTFDSYGARVTYSPSARVALHAARSFLNEPEALEPGVDQWRTTASALYSAPLGPDGDLSTALVWGANDLRPPDVSEHAAGVQHAVLAEATLRFGSQAVYGRAEYTQKSAEELALEGEEFHDRVFDVTALTVGAARDAYTLGGLTATLGAQGTLFGVPADLRPVYGSTPISLQVYLRITPSRMTRGATGHDGHAGM
jgi:hypothetical protein